VRLLFSQEHPLHKKAVFLDRDGTVIVDTEFSVDVAKLCPLPGTMTDCASFRRRDTCSSSSPTNPASRGEI